MGLELVDQQWGRYGLHAKGFTPVVRYFYDTVRELRIAPADAFLLIRLMDYKGTDETCYPGMSRLAMDLGVTRYTVQRMIDRLVEQGVLWKTRRRVNGKKENDSNTYSLEPLFKKMDQLAVEQRRKANLPPGPVLGEAPSAARQAGSEYLPEPEPTGDKAMVFVLQNRAELVERCHTFAEGYSDKLPPEERLLDMCLALARRAVEGGFGPDLALIALEVADAFAPRHNDPSPEEGVEPAA